MTGVTGAVRGRHVVMTDAGGTHTCEKQVDRPLLSARARQTPPEKQLPLLLANFVETCQSFRTKFGSCEIAGSSGDRALCEKFTLPPLPSADAICRPVSELRVCPGQLSPRPADHDLLSKLYPHKVLLSTSFQKFNAWIMFTFIK